MKHNISQSQVEQECLNRGYILLSEYKNSITKIKIKLIKTGDIYDVYRRNLITGKRPERRVKKYTREDAIKILNDVGYDLIGEYKNSSEKIHIQRRETGKKYYASLGNIIDNHLPHRSNIIEENEAIKYLETNGYKLLSTYKNGDQDITLLSPEGNIWHTNFFAFKAGVRCPIDSSINRMSRGERFVYSILTENKDIFSNIEREKTVIINGQTHRFDFCFIYRNKTYIIEYDGYQHFHPVEYFGGAERLQDNINKDTLKNIYCVNNNIKMIRISYHYDTINKIFNFLRNNNFPDIKEARVTLIKEKDIAEYYLYHSKGETIKKFGVTNINQSFKNTYGCTKKEYLEKHILDEEREIAEYYLLHTKIETAKEFNISLRRIDNCFNKVFGETKSKMQH